MRSAREFKTLKAILAKLRPSTGPTSGIAGAEGLCGAVERTISQTAMASGTRTCSTGSAIAAIWPDLGNNMQRI